ncbi:MAG: synthase [Pedobacter sp.]|jgi:GMP synthase-like glutamine amidotransferase|nr:synthase [Pedobacter sp.]
MKLKVAIIDMNNGQANQGMRGIKEILSLYQQNNDVEFSLDIFDLRQKEEIPGLEYNIYFSTGGPGSPLEGTGERWENLFFDFLEQIKIYNEENDQEKKYLFLICHSFQLACVKFGLGNVTQRKSNAFGIFPINLTEEGKQDSIFGALTDPFFSVDSRDWQVIEPNAAAFEGFGAKILALEKERENVDLERCIMAIRFTNEIVGTQFHPEADPVGMKMYLLKDEKKNTIIENHGEEKYHDMLESLDDPARIRFTQTILLPNFLNEAVHSQLEAIL